MSRSSKPCTGRILHCLSVLLVWFSPALTAQIPESALSVRLPDGKFVVWWRSPQAPARWGAPNPAVVSAIKWRNLGPGLETAGLDLSGGSAGWRVHIILARFDPTLLLLQLHSDVIDAKPAWSIDAAPTGAVLAVNAGQFESDLPWGWVVQNGREVQPPRAGPLSSALVVDSAGHASIVDAAEIPGIRARGNYTMAFQSYPAILVDNAMVPDALRGPSRGVDLEHRDSRLSLGILPDGKLLLALTRFGSVGSALTRLPFGPTTPEMAAIMGALGCRRAVLLDGGLSGQLMMRDSRGRTEKWPGLRSVPLGLIAVPKK